MEKTIINCVLFLVIACCVPLFSMLTGAEARSRDKFCVTQNHCKDYPCGSSGVIAKCVVHHCLCTGAPLPGPIGPVVPEIAPTPEAHHCFTSADCKDVICVIGEVVCGDGICICIDQEQSDKKPKQCSKWTDCTGISCPLPLEKLECVNGECKCVNWP